MTNENTPASSLTDKEREAIAQMPYEEARDQLIQAVQALEAGGLNLDQSMRQWGLAKPSPSALKVCSAKCVPSLTQPKRNRPLRPIPLERKTIWPENLKNRQYIVST